MKRFKVNKFLYLIVPTVLTLIIVTYMVVLFKQSFLWANIINLTIDATVLIYYLLRFCLEMSIDTSSAYFKTMFKRHRVEVKGIYSVRQASFLTRVETEKGSFYILTTHNGKSVLKDILFTFSNKK